MLIIAVTTNSVCTTSATGRIDKVITTVLSSKSISVAAQKRTQLFIHLGVGATMQRAREAMHALSNAELHQFKADVEQEAFRRLKNRFQYRLASVWLPVTLTADTRTDLFDEKFLDWSHEKIPQDFGWFDLTGRRPEVCEVLGVWLGNANEDTWTNNGQGRLDLEYLPYERTQVGGALFDPQWRQHLLNFQHNGFVHLFKVPWNRVPLLTWRELYALWQKNPSNIVGGFERVMDENGLVGDFQIELYIPVDQARIL